ncbi:MAG TPA: hypothetical protein PKA41_06295 [Verrucomicrobiota bacterium]|nr:hypothetical protein [Verrucomicrobiota bacterium]
MGRASKWNAEEARIENEYKSKLAAYTNRKNAYLKDKAEYDNANILKRQLMREPVDPGVPPVREANTILKPVEIAELDAQIKDKETELLAIHNKRRDAVAQVASDARRVREEFDRRSSTKREETDRKRDELLAALALATTQWAAEEKLVNEEYQAAAAKVDGIRAELDAARKRAEGFYEAREAAIRNTQVHRIATTVEIVRGLIFGERPMSITATARERGDILTDQISMVRIWVYPVLAFIVAFLPTLLVEIGFSTVFKPDQQQRPQHRLGFLGRRMHWLYTRAGRLKILRAERIAREASDEIAARDRALANEKTTAEQALAAKEIELQAAHEAAAAAAAEHEVQLKQKEDEWVAKFAGIADSLNKSVAEKDALRALQNVEIERQVQQRQNAWADRVNELSKELDTRRDAAEAERKGLIQEHHKKLQEVTETAKSQIAQARRLAAETELASQEKTSKLEFALKEALDARDAAIADSRQQIEALSLKLAQAREDGARELEKASRQEKHRLELNQLEVAKQLRLREEEFEREQQKREQELAATFEARLIEEQAKTAQAARRRDDELERQLEARVRENDARWRQEIQRIEADAVSRLDAREQQLQAQTEVRIGDIQSQAEQELRRQQSEFERQFEARDREADARLRQELQQREIAFHSKLKQRELELNTRAAARETELQSQWAADFRARQEEWEKQAEARVRAAEARLNQDSQQKEELFQMKLRQREQQLQSQFDARQAELQAQRDQDIHNRQQEWERNAQDAARAVEQRWMADLQQKEELFQSKLRQRDQQWQARLDAVRAESQAQSEEALLRQETESGEARQRALRELEVRVRKEMQEKHDAAFAEAAQHEQNLVAQLAGQAEAQRIAERERDEALQSAVETAGQMKELKEKLLAASTLLAGWKGGNGGGHDGNGFGNGNGRHLVLAGSGRNS